jgi:hypothetical protein
MRIHWWEDSSGYCTCHQNIPGLNFKESFLGEIHGNIINGYYYRISGSVEWTGNFSSPFAARKALEKALDVSTLNEESD